MKKDRSLGDRRIPFEKGMRTLMHNRPADDPFLPVLAKGDLRGFEESWPVLHLHRVKLSELGERSELDRSQHSQRRLGKARKPVRQLSANTTSSEPSGARSARQPRRCCCSRSLALSWWGALDEAASLRTHAALQRALVTFALTRTLNGVISVAQGTELAFEPAGVGVVISAGEILDPLNDLVEQFSWLTLLAATSLGIQIMLGEMFATPRSTSRCRSQSS